MSTQVSVKIISENGVGADYNWKLSFKDFYHVFVR